MTTAPIHFLHVPSLRTLRRLAALLVVLLGVALVTLVLAPRVAAVLVEELSPTGVSVQESLGTTKDLPRDWRGHRPDLRLEGMYGKGEHKSAPWIGNRERHKRFD